MDRLLIVGPRKILQASPARQLATSPDGSQGARASRLRPAVSRTIFRDPGPHDLPSGLSPHRQLQRSRRMSPRHPMLAPLLILGLAAPALADDSGSFVVTLGQDTTSIEHYTRSAARTEVRQVGRSPRVLERLYTY